MQHAKCLNVAQHISHIGCARGPAKGIYLVKSLPCRHQQVSLYNIRCIMLPEMSSTAGATSLRHMVQS